MDNIGSDVKQIKEQQEPRSESIRESQLSSDSISSKN
jgi:hypothetical protein